MIYAYYDKGHWKLGLKEMNCICKSCKLYKNKCKIRVAEGKATGCIYHKKRGK